VSHILNLVQGISVSLMCGVLFYLTALALFPRRWEQFLRSSTLTLTGAAIFVLLCWIVVTARELPLVRLVAVFVMGVAGLSSFRWRWVLLTAKSRMPSAIGTMAAFSCFYMVAYSVTWPPAGDVFLPPAWNGNLDLLTHVQYAKHLLLFGSARLESASFDYLDSPASSYLLALMSIGYSQDPLRAAMPLMFALVSVSALALMQGARTVFGQSKLTALAAVFIFLIGPLMRYVSAAYHVGWLTGFPVLIYLVWAVRSIRPAGFADFAAIGGLSGAYTLLFFLDPALVLIGLIVQTTSVIAQRDRKRWREATQLAVGAAIPTIFLAASFVDRVQWAVAGSRLRSVFALSDLAPQALIGWPSRVPGRSSAELPAGVLALFLSAMLLAFVGGLISRFVVNHEFARAEDRALLRACVAYTAIILVVGNIIVHAVGDPRLIRLPGPWRGIEQLQNQPFTDLTLKIDYDPGGLMAAVARYYLPNKKIDIVSRSVRTRDMPFEVVSRHTPLLLQGFGCEGVGHGEVVSIDRVGCVLLAPPTIELGKRYPFNRTMLAVEYDGMGERDPGGRWSTDRTLSLRVTVDPQRTRVDRSLYLNILLDPFLPTGEIPPRLVLAWGTANRAEIAASRASWISVPVAVGDWSGNRLWTVRLRIDFPDRRRILFRDLMLSDEPAKETGS
jgi:hypothetical protein